MTAVEERLWATVSHLAEIERAPCSPGEREAAEYLAAELRRHCGDVRIEEERVHGTFHWMLLALSVIAMLGRLPAAVSLAAMWEDLRGGRRRWFRHHALPQGTTTNVIATAGDADAGRTLVVLAHHDAARTSFLFDQGLPRLLHAKAPGLLARMDRWPPVMRLVLLGPLLVLLGRKRAGRVLCAGTAAVMADLGTNDVVPAANDNATACAVLVELARDLEERPVAGLRVLLVSAGAEEANQEGIVAFANRHFADLPVQSTSFLCLDTLGSPNLTLIEGEGFLDMHDYPEAFKQRVTDAAVAADVDLRRGVYFTFATDGLVPLRAGYPTASVGSLTDYMVPSNYHWPTDTADRVDYATVAAATRMSRRLIDDLAR